MMFDDYDLFEMDLGSADQFDYQSTQPDGHSVRLIPGHYTQRGQLYAVVHNGQVLIPESYDPELDACRMLLDMGLTGKLTTYRGHMACMILDIEKAAQVSVRDNHSGTPVFIKYREGH
jgi:hypothetical protein